MVSPFVNRTQETKLLLSWKMTLEVLVSVKALPFVVCKENSSRPFGSNCGGGSCAGVWAMGMVIVARRLVAEPSGLATTAL